MPSRTVELDPRAISEARAAYQWYRDRNPSAAWAFADEMDRAVATIAENPALGSPYLNSTRRLLFRRLSYFVVYRFDEATIRILAVAHARRRPGYWFRA